jgi:Vacuolar protein sorting-associated protein 35
MISTGNAELGVRLYIDVALAADNIASVAKDKTFTQIAVDLMSQGVLLHEEDISESKSQERCVVKIIGALVAFQSLCNEEYERFITKAAQFSAKLVKKQEQCRMVALCAHLFYPSVRFSFFSVLFYACKLTGPIFTRNAGGQILPKPTTQPRMPPAFIEARRFEYFSVGWQCVFVRGAAGSLR